MRTVSAMVLDLTLSTRKGYQKEGLPRASSSVARSQRCIIIQLVFFCSLSRGRDSEFVCSDLRLLCVAVQHPCRHSCRFL